MFKALSDAIFYSYVNTRAKIVNHMITSKLTVSAK